MPSSSGNIIQHYYSKTASAVPIAANLYDGELALNTQDGKLFYKDAAGVVQVLATKSVAGGTVGNLQLSGNTLSSTNSNGNIILTPDGTGVVNITKNLDVDGDVNIDGGDLTASTASFNLVNGTVATLNLAGAATAINIGHVGTGARTVSIGTAATGGASTLTFGGAVTGNILKVAGTAAGAVNLTSDVTTGTVNLFTGTTTGTVNVGSAAAGKLAVVFNTTATSTTTGALTVAGGASVTENLWVGGYINVDNLRLQDNTLSSTNADGNIVLAPNGAGDVQLDADTIRIGDSNAAVTLTTNGASNLTINTGAVGATAAGNTITITGGTGGATSGAGGAVTVQGGSAQTSGAAGALNLYGGAAVGTNQTGADVTIRAGNGTGTGGSGNIVFQTAAAGTSGTTVNTLTTRVSIAPTGTVTMSGGVVSTSTTTGTLIVTGGVGVSGALNATTKSFIIDHPTKPGKLLKHGSLEGPEFGVYVRGKSTDKVIELPEYWMGLVDAKSITVDLTPIGKHQKLYVEKIEDNKVYVECDSLFSSSMHFFYTVWGTRKDVEKLEVEGE